MNTALKFAIAAVAVVVVALVGITLLPRSGGVGGSGPGATATPSGTPTPTPSMTAPPSPIVSPSAATVPNGFPEGPLQAGTHTIAPFAPPNGEGVCHQPPQPGCTETHLGDALRFTLTVPDGWFGAGHWVWPVETGSDAPGGAGLSIERGAWLLIDPCVEKEDNTNWIPVGPTVADFVDAVAKHPILDTTTPVDATLAGYSGKYFDLQVPADISTDAKYNPGCVFYRPWEPGIYAQGPNHRWHVWVLDVDGARVVISSSDYPGTPTARRAELQAIVDSITFHP